MKKLGRPDSKIEKECLHCNKKFKVIKCREKTAFYCSRKCSDNDKKGKAAWNKGKSYEELYSSSEMERIKNIQSAHSSGENNPIYGTIRSEETRRKISEANKGNTGGWMKGKKFTGIFSHLDRLGKNNGYVKWILKQNNITYEEYQKRMGEFKLYYRVVKYITSKQPIHTLKNFDKRGRAPMIGAYNLDHIYPISIGFKNNIPPEIIGDISNLRFIPWEENIKKSNKLENEKCIRNGDEFHWDNIGDPFKYED